MTDLALKLEQKLTQLAPGKARALERVVREAMALADAAETMSGTNDLLNLRIHAIALMSEDFRRLAEALNEPPRELPRLRELLTQSSRLGHG